MGDQPWLTGRPFYCATCGAGYAEYVACEEPDCKLETAEAASARRDAHYRDIVAPRGTGKSGP